MFTPYFHSLKITADSQCDLVKFLEAIEPEITRYGNYYFSYAPGQVSSFFDGYDEYSEWKVNIKCFDRGLISCTLETASIFVTMWAEALQREFPKLRFFLNNTPVSSS